MSKGFMLLLLLLLNAALGGGDGSPSLVELAQMNELKAAARPSVSQQILFPGQQQRSNNGL